MNPKDTQFPTIFLDRDGTINVDHGYVVTRDRLELENGSAEAIASFKNMGFKIVVVSNQSAIGRNMATEEMVIDTNNYLQKLLLAQNSKALIDQFLFCGDHPENSTQNRKPGIGMLSQLNFNYLPSESYMIGDKVSDIEFGINAKIPSKNCYLISEGGKKTCNYQNCKSLLDAKNIIKQFILHAPTTNKGCNNNTNS